MQLLQANFHKMSTKHPTCVIVKRNNLCSDSSNDELFVVMSQCKSIDMTAHFIRDVKAGPDPALVLATDQQLNDVVKFFTSPDEFTVITVDPTFNLGDFDVTPLTYPYSQSVQESPLHFETNVDPL